MAVRLSILSALQTATYKLAKFFVPILEPLTTNKYTIKYSLNFATEIVEQDSFNFMGSLDIVNILLAACRRFAMVRISDNGPGWK